MKIIVQTTNPKYGLLNTDGIFIHPNRPNLALLTPLLEQRIANGSFSLVVGNLSDEATDEEFVKFLKESGDDQQLALESFESRYSLDDRRRETEDEKKERVEKLQKLAKEQKEREDKDAADLLAKQNPPAPDAPAAPAADAGKQTPGTPIVK